MRTDPPKSRMTGPERTSSTRFLPVDADGDVGPDYRPCTVLAVGFPIKIINSTANTTGVTL